MWDSLRPTLAVKTKGIENPLNHFTHRFNPPEVLESPRLPEDLTLPRRGGEPLEYRGASMG